MRVTVFRGTDGEVSAEVSTSPTWEPLEEYDGKPLHQVRLAVVDRLPSGEIQLVEIAAGGHFAMYTNPDVAFCQIVRGRGKLGLPDGPRSPTRVRSCTSSTPLPARLARRRGGHAPVGLSHPGRGLQG
jgi:hypothetical protein